MAHHSRRLLAAANGAHQCRKGHPAGGHAVVISRDNHHPISLRYDDHNALAAATGGHRGIHQGVDSEAVHTPIRVIVYEIVNPFPYPFHRVETLPLRNGLVGAGGLYLKGGAAVQPGVGAAEAGALGIDNTNVIGSEGLTQGAAIIGVHCFIGHPCRSLIPFAIDVARLLD